MTYDYQPIDRYITLNQDDSDLFPIRIDLLDLVKRTHRQYNLPEPDDFPPFEQVHGYGLDPKDQVFEREEVPETLIRLERGIRNKLKKEKRITNIKIELGAIEQFWEELETNPQKWETEIQWLKLMWQYRLLGKYFFINGKVYWMPGNCWFFLNWYRMDNILPEFRLWDMYIQIGWEFAKYDTTTFANIDPDTGKPIPNEEGIYDMIDTGQRVCLGVNDAKSRRVGDTSRSQANGMEEATRTMEYHFGTQGRDEPHAKKVFQQQFVHPFEQIPIFFKPVWDSNLGVKPREHMMFDGETSDFGLHTRITHALSANAENYNGDKLHFYHRDEAGNTENEDVNKSHDIVKQCLRLGTKIIGFSLYTTTVQEVDSGSAGENYMNLCMDSDYGKRNDNGQTTSGLYNIFIPAEYRVEGKIDKYGFPVAGKPTPEQAAFIGSNEGAIDFIENTTKDLTRKKDWTKLAIHQRQYPRKFRQCFSPPGKNQFFPSELIRNQLQNIQFANRSLLPKRGNFEWTSGFGSDVVWVDSDRGRWFKSREFAPQDTNRRRQIGGIWYPDDKFSVVHSADTFGSDQPKGRASLGGLAARWLWDETIDPKTKPSELWQTDRLIITYKFRPDTVDEFCEDVLKQIIYCGGLLYPERNKDLVEPYIRRHGYDGYLLYDYDHTGKQIQKEAGFYSQEKVKQKIFSYSQKELQKNIARTNHPDWLEECLLILGPEQMNRFDLFTAVGGTLLASHNPYYWIMKRNKAMSINTTRWMTEQEY